MEQVLIVTRDLDLPLLEGVVAIAIWKDEKMAWERLELSSDGIWRDIDPSSPRAAISREELGVKDFESKYGLSAPEPGTKGYIRTDLNWEWGNE